MAVNVLIFNLFLQCQKHSKDVLLNCSPKIIIAVCAIVRSSL